MWQNSQIFGYIGHGIQINKYSLCFFLFNWILYFSQMKILIGCDGEIEEVAENMENLGIGGLNLGKKLILMFKLDYWGS